MALSLPLYGVGYVLMSFKFIFVFGFAIYFIPEMGWTQFYYGNQMKFGKNVCVYNRFDWNFYRAKSYDVYYYKRGNSNAQYILYELPGQIKKLNDFFDVKFQKRIKVICFNNLTDMKQSNLNSLDEKSFGKAGTMQVYQEKVFVYSTGSRSDLLMQLQEALVKVYLGYISQGENFFSSAQSTYSVSSLPNWFVRGLARFVSKRQIFQVKQMLRDATVYRYLDEFNTQSSVLPDVIGYSLFDYLQENYGKKMMQEVIYYSASFKNIKRGMENVLQMPYEEIIENWKNYYKNEYARIKERELPNLVTASGEEEYIYQISMSEDKEHIVYAVNELGAYKVYVQNIKTGEKQKIISGGYNISRNQDISYPMVAWHPKGKFLAMIIEKKGDVYMVMYDLENKQKEEKYLTIFDKVVGISYSRGGDKIVMTAVKNGFSDVYVYHTQKGGVEKITQDSYDENYAVFCADDRYILFSSNRDNDTIKFSREYNLGKQYYDLYMYDYRSRNKILNRVTYSNDKNEIMSQNINGDIFSYVERNDSGDSFVNVVKRDSTIAYIDTIIHYKNVFKAQKAKYDTKDVFNYKVYENTNSWAQIQYNDRGYNLQWFDNLNENLPGNFKKRIPKYSEKIVDEVILEVPKKRYPVDIDNYIFEDRLTNRDQGPKDELDIQSLVKTSNTTGRGMVIDPKSYNKYKRMYERIFFPTQISSQMGKPFENRDYQPFTGGTVSQPTGVSNMMMEVKLKDIFEDYVLVGGFKFNPSNFRSGLSLSANNEILIKLEDRKEMWNKTYIFYRKASVSQVSIYDERNIITYNARHRLSYPFSPVASFNISYGYKNDNIVYLSKEYNSLKKEKDYRHYASLLVSYIYDNSINFELNLHRGFKYKIFADVNIDLDFPKDIMLNLGIDVRYYYRIHRNLIWANRFSVGTSLGSLALVHYLGGIDSELVPRFNRETPVARGYAFQTLMTNIRGFKQNIRNGRTFTLFNTEFRLPIIQYFYNAPLNLDIFKHFQVVPFFDIGAAWNGIVPWQDDLFVYKSLERYKTKVTVKRNQLPFVMGYGVGFRTMLFGTFIRVDIARGIDTYEIGDTYYHVSFSYDF